jgi:hypothetical protein
MKLDLSDPRTQRLVIVAGVILLVLIGVIIIIVRSRSKFAFPTSISAGDDGVLYNAIQACTSTYRVESLQGVTTKDINKATCIRNAIDAFIGSKCPFISTNAKPTDPTGAAAYDLLNRSTIVSGEASLIAITASSNYANFTAAGTNVGSTSISIDQVKKARKADMTGPTRKYLSTACSGIYTPASGGNDPSATYQGFTVAGSTATLPTPLVYGFYNTLVTAPRILEWLIRAADPVVVGTGGATSVTTTGATIPYAPSSFTFTASQKLSIPGVSGAVTVGSVTTGSITVTFATQAAAPTISAGTGINRWTQAEIRSVAPGQSGPVTNLSTNTPYTGSGTTSFTECAFGLSAALDDSIKVGTPVLLSGLSFTGIVTLKSGAGTNAISVQFDSQPIPYIALGQTIENAMAVPLAAPVLSTPPLHVTTAVAAASASAVTITVNGITGLTAGTTLVKIPSLGLPTATNTIKVTAASGTSVTLTHYVGATATSLSWPAMPPGTVIVDASSNNPIAQTVANATYNKTGKLLGTMMQYWQINQSTGPGTTWPVLNGVAQPEWA